MAGNYSSLTETSQDSNNHTCGKFAEDVYTGSKDANTTVGLAREPNSLKVFFFDKLYLACKFDAESRTGNDIQIIQFEPTIHQIISSTLPNEKKKNGNTNRSQSASIFLVLSLMIVHYAIIRMNK
jgi:hypothetical protein